MRKDKQVPESVKLKGHTEKTCQVIGYSVTSDERTLMCQLSCGHSVPSLDLGPFNPSFSHCPRCNAKLVRDVH